ncbi:MAG: hypothetical protein JW727_00255 [Candidatus Aenigmarchaeota archaeon]|nr:hypothetical protein [Candidatus Aenigmarchaeota archaeon]
MLLQLLGLVDIVVSVLLFMRFQNPLALILIFLLLIKGLSCFVPILPPVSFIVHFCVFVDLMAAILVIMSYGFTSFIGLPIFFYYLIKGIWTLIFGLIFN